MLIGQGVTVRAVTCNDPARYLGTSGVPPKIQELNTAAGQCSGSTGGSDRGSDRGSASSSTKDSSTKNSTRSLLEKVGGRG